ncbi:MAG: hypothetical protein Q8O41_03865 [Candidatus Methanoperedens sp.]|nr:hypothetical protein [Candidatus Methanoperedens sp.]
MEPLERAELLLAKSKDDETLLEEIISNEKVRDEIIGFHAQQAAEKKKNHSIARKRWKWSSSCENGLKIHY